MRQTHTQSLCLTVVTDSDEESLNLKACEMCEQNPCNQVLGTTVQNCHFNLANGKCLSERQKETILYLIAVETHGNISL